MSANTLAATSDSLFIPTDAPNTPMGNAKGIFPGRVVWMWDSTAAKWNGTSGNWWSDASTNQTVVDSMLSRSLRSLTGKFSDTASWEALFNYFNIQHGKGNTGYAKGEKIAVKLNLNNSQNPGNPGNISFTSPQVVLSLLRQLVNKAGVPDSNITFYDLIRYAPDPIFTKCKSEFPGVHFMGWMQINGRELYVRDTAYIHWSVAHALEKDASVSAKGGNTTYLPTVVTRAAYIINLGSLKGHSYAGITCCAKNHFGTLSVDDDNGLPYEWAPHAAGAHAYVAVHYVLTPGSPEWTFNARPMGTYNVLVDLMGHKDLGGKTLLFMADALYAVPTEHGTNITNSCKWLSAPFNDNWTSSLFLSQDNVAIESVCLDFLRTEQAANPTNYTQTYGAVDNYLHEASQANNPPSGTFYAPSGDGVRLQSLGVHEHWNNATDKKYSRNLGTGNGIELVSLKTSTFQTSIEQNHFSDFSLRNYPNPFKSSTTISYQLSVQGIVLLQIFNSNGQEITTIVNKEQTPGLYEVPCNAGKLESGIYYYRLQLNQSSGTLIETRKFVLTK